MKAFWRFLLCVVLAVLALTCVVKRDDGSYSGAILDWSDEITNEALKLERKEVLLVQRRYADGSVQIIDTADQHELNAWMMLRRMPQEWEVDPNCVQWAIYSDMQPCVVFAALVDDEYVPYDFGYGIPNRWEMMAGKFDFLLKHYLSKVVDRTFGIVVVEAMELMGLAFFPISVLALVADVKKSQSDEPESKKVRVSTEPKNVKTQAS